MPALTPDELLSTTRAVRRRLDFDRPVERRLIEECLELALQAPSGKNRQHWEFVVVADPELKQALAQLYLLGLQHGRDLVSPPGSVDRVPDTPERWRRVREGSGHLAMNLHRVPYLVIPCVHAPRREYLDTTTAQANIWGSVLPATWSFMLAARARGLGTVFTTPHLNFEKEAAELLGVPYPEVMQTCLIPVAHTLGEDFRPARRAPVAEVTHWDTW